MKFTTTENLMLDFIFLEHIKIMYDEYTNHICHKTSLKMLKSRYRNISYMDYQKQFIVINIHLLLAYIKSAIKTLIHKIAMTWDKRLKPIAIPYQKLFIKIVRSLILKYKHVMFRFIFYGACTRMAR